MRKIKISPSIMCADFLHLEREVKELEKAGADMLHFDIMDGHFVPNLTMGPDFVKAVRKITGLPFDIHLMINEPERYIKRFIEAAGSPQTATKNILSVHKESCKNLPETLRLIKNCGANAAVAVKPSTPLRSLKPVFKNVSMILIMMVEPGFAGQKLIPGTIGKIRELKNMIDKKGLNIDIEVDGNVSNENIPDMIKAGANVLVSGSSGVFRKNTKIKDAIKDLKRTVNKI
jgi:ribulose-phosphate 3-epimerase